MVPKTENKIIIYCFFICLRVPQITYLPTGSRMKSAEENGKNFNNQHNLTTRNDLPIICKPGWSFSATWMAERDLKRRIPANPACLQLVQLLLYNYTLPFQQTRILKISVPDPDPGWFFSGSRSPNPYFFSGSRSPNPYF